MHRFYFILSLLALFIIPNFSNAQPNTGSAPRVFEIGAYEKEFEQLQLQHSYQLLSVCNDDMDAAYGLWIDMLRSMEELDASLAGFDLNGVNIWLYMFWSKDGSISHLAYYLKPNSRFVKAEELNTFMVQFANRYKLPLDAPAANDFSHYGAAFFPTASLLINKE